MQIEHSYSVKKRPYLLLNDDGKTIAAFANLAEAALCARYLSGAAMSDLDSARALQVFRDIDASTEARKKGNR